MSSIEEIESAIKELPKDQIAKLRDWFEEYEAQTWDKQIENDARSGKLDNLAQVAINEYRAGRTSKI